MKNKNPMHWYYVSRTVMLLASIFAMISMLYCIFIALKHFDLISAQELQKLYLRTDVIYSISWLASSMLLVATFVLHKKQYAQVVYCVLAQNIVFPLLIIVCVQRLTRLYVGISNILATAQWGEDLLEFGYGLTSSDVMTQSLEAAVRNTWTRGLTLAGILFFVLLFNSIYYLKRRQRIKSIVFE